MRQVQLEQSGRTAQAAARLVLVAAGIGKYRSTRGADARTQIAAGSRIGAGCLVADAAESYTNHKVYMAVGRTGYVGIVRVEDGRLNVAAAFGPGIRPTTRHAGSRGKAQILAEAGFNPIAALETAQWQGTPRLARKTRPLASERLFLLGDAAGYVEPFTGEGIAWALASAQAIAPLALRAIEQWDPRLSRAWWNMHCRRLIERRWLVCRCATRARPAVSLTHIGFAEFCRFGSGCRRGGFWKHF